MFPEPYAHTLCYKMQGAFLARGTTMLHPHLNNTVLLVATLLPILIGTQVCAYLIEPQCLQISTVGPLFLFTLNQQM